ncbi:hypothetical protein RJ640_013878 [Escallonia rubra]|uniref:Protein FAR1-RELATED SEQUENCE n=1 Tax=Escallonia rubra TaxID=112253 RepID=A0AA88U729_9ASTE|nr:hypothetical protein RJ640_013878 [Escallonia rubra]
MDIGGCSNTLSSSSMGKANDNEQELDDVCTMQSCQSNVHGGKVHEVPTIGMEFDSKQHAFDYYSEYAHRIGFSYDLLLQDRHYTELKSEFKMRQTAPVPVANVEMLRHVVEVYTPEMFNMFQHEYIKAWDYSIHKVFLDKKNVKRIPTQYILKRWTKDAKDAIVSDYRGTQIQGNSQESIGKRYSYLSHDFQELVTAAENEDMYTYGHQNLSKLRKDLEEMKRTYCSNTWDLDTNTQDDLPRNVSQLNDGAVSQCPRGIKVKATVGRPRKRFKDPLEQPRRRRSQAKATQGTSSSGQGSQQKGRKLGQSANQEEHYDKENEISTVIDITVNNEHDVGDDTLFPPTQDSSEEKAQDAFEISIT